jgi:hypothetical protein
LPGGTKVEKALRIKKIAKTFLSASAKRLKLSVAAITQSVERGERLKEEKSYHFL